MVKRIGGSRRKTRAILKKKPSQRGKFSLTTYFQTFKKGDKVLLKAEPSMHKGMFFKRFSGKLGIVEAKQGVCYRVSVDDFGKKKTIIVHPVHLKKY